jgi:hypothetical protein
MQEGQEENKISKYNSAVAQLYRLDNLWQRCHEYRLIGNLSKWNDTLDCVWTELAADTGSNITKTYKKIKDDIIKYKSKRSQFYQVLMLKEIFLRKIQNKQGKGTAYQEDDEGL